MSARFKYISAPQAAEITGLGVRTLGRLEAAGKFPRKIPLGNKRRAYIDVEIYAWNLKQARKARGKDYLPPSQSPDENVTPDVTQLIAAE